MQKKCSDDDTLGAYKHICSAFCGFMLFLISQWKHKLTWTRPSWQKLDTAAGSDDLCWKPERKQRCLGRRCRPARTWRRERRNVSTWNNQMWQCFLAFCIPWRVTTHLSATARSLSGLKVPSVSMYMALPSPPPWSMGSCGHRGHSRHFEFLSWDSNFTDNTSNRQHNFDGYLIMLDKMNWNKNIYKCHCDKTMWGNLVLFPACGTCLLLQCDYLNALSKYSQKGPKIC